jgi:uncharacterized membrane protein
MAKTSSSDNPAFVPHENQQWTQEYADGLRDHYAKFRYQKYAIMGTLIAAMIISLIATKGVEDLSNFTSFSDFKWGFLGRYIAILLAALFFTHWVAAMLFAKYSFHCPLCTKIIYTQGDWSCPYCDKRNQLYTFLFKCGRWL